MAVLALGFIGTAIGGGIGGSVLGVTAASIGGFIGSTVGGLIDNMLFAGTTKVQGPRLEDKRVMVSTYGQTIPKCYGPENRIAGLVFWSTGLIEDVHVEKQGGKGGPSVQTTSYTYRASFALLLEDGPASGVAKMWANSKLIYDRDGTGSPPVEKVLFADLRFYPGDGAQLPDPLIEAALGVGNTPAYRHSCYVVIEDLQLADFGNRIPNIEVLLEADEEITLPAVVADICRRCGADPNEISTSGLARTPIRGYSITGSARGADALQPLALAYGFDSAEQGGNLRFVRRGLAARGTILLGELGAAAERQEPDEPVRFDLMPPVVLPREAVVSFADPARDYQRNSQPSRRQFGDADSNLSYDLAIVLEADEGRRIADRMLFEAWTSRRTAGFSTNLRYRFARPGDCYLVESPAGFTRVRLTRILRGANGLIQVESREDDPVIYQSTAPATPAAIPVQTIRAPGETRLVMFDPPILQDADDDAGFYYAAAGLGDGWRGANLLRSADGGSTYAQVAPIRHSSPLGDVADALPAGPVDFWDEANVLTVVLARGDLELESASELAVLNGANAAWLGDEDNPADGEVLQFKTATLIAPGAYELTGLLRGRLGTEHAVGAHGPGETFVLLLGGYIGRPDFGASDWNKDRDYKAVSLLTDAASTTADAFASTGEGKRPLSPVQITGERDGSNNLTLEWFRRSRLRQPGFGNGFVPLGESVESYEVDILDVGETAVLRTIAAATPTASYSAAEQTADGLTPGDPVHLRIYQLSDVRGRGRPGSAVV